MWIPADRFLEVIDKIGGPGYAGKGSPTHRRILELRAGRQKFIGLDTADKILVGLGAEHYWHLPREHGGLADIYEDGADYGRPNNHLAFGKPRLVHETEEKRVEARRRTWRESKRRKRAAA